MRSRRRLNGEVSVARPDMKLDARGQLADQQSAVLRALTCRGPPPDGFSPNRLAAIADELLKKRSRNLWRAWPVLAASLGDSAEDWFVRFASQHPLPSAGPMLDGRNFAEWLEQQHALPFEGRVALTAFVARFRSTDTETQSRRIGACLRIFRRPWHFAMAIHALGIGGRVVSCSWPPATRARSTGTVG